MIGLRKLARLSQASRKKVYWAAKKCKLHEPLKHPNSPMLFTDENALRVLLALELRRKRWKRDRGYTSGEGLRAMVQHFGRTWSGERFLITDGRTVRYMDSAVALLEKMKNVDVGVHVVDLDDLLNQLKPAKAKAAAA